ncbi:MYB transcription factor [Quillaja saponaria]|uniref:MYB transcription factor n=1 Tax=Quillaja saponaria TaxID=32244 RepID=A0AAD7KUF4_QUISA|nr:MYB transcription factor [Quillaja saponaria]KAJ7945948.1 MYB transcription factor [Quillaja saponaria]
MVRPPCCDKMNAKRGLWTADEDAKMIACISKHGPSNWTAVPKKGLKRCGKSCRLRWNNYLKPDLQHDSFTPQEEELIVKLHAAIGSRWAIIAQQLPGRTDNDVKNYWNTRLRKKLSEMGIDPITHKPYSQILADYGNISGLQKPSTRNGSLGKDFKNAIILNSEPYPIPPQRYLNISSLPMQSIMSPSRAPVQSNFLNNYNHNNNHCMDLLAQLQAIKLVTGSSNWIGSETIPQPIFGDGCLSSTSSPLSSSTCSTAAQENSPLAFSWNDFLLEDAIPQAADHARDDQEIVAKFLSEDFVSQAESVTQQIETKKEVSSQDFDEAKRLDHADAVVLPSNEFQLSSSSDISFVESMLDQEDEMFLNFPDLMEEPLYN